MAWVQRDTSTALAGDTSIEALFRRGQRFYVRGTPSQAFAYSESGETWTAESTFVADFSTSAFIDTGTAWIIVGLNTSLNRGQIYRSVDDGANWTQVFSSTGWLRIEDVAFDGVTLIAVEAAANTLWSDDDGATWNSVFSGLSGFPSLKAIVSVGVGKFVAAGMGGDYGRIITTSDSGLNWTSRSNPFGEYESVDGLAFNGSRVLAVGGYGVIATSDNDGETWTSRTSGTSQWLADADFADSLFAVAAETTVLSSADGETWGAFDSADFSAGTAGLRNILKSNGVWVVAGDGISMGVPFIATNGTYVGEFEEADGTDTGEASSTMEYEQIGFAADLLSTAAGTSSMSAQPIFFATVSGAGAAASTLSVGVIHQGDITSSGVGTSPMTTQALLNALLFSTIAANSTQALEEQGPTAWALNAESGGSTRYEDFPFNSFAVIDGIAYGARESGIYRLEGDDDNGSPIPWMVRFGKQDFGTSAMKSVSNAYLGVSSTGRVFMKVIVGDNEYIYASRGAHEQMKVQRIDTGHGIRASYLEFEIFNEDGDDAELASVEFVITPMSRRI